MCQKQIYTSSGTYMPHMPITLFADIRQLCQYICLIGIHCNQHCDHKHWYIYIHIIGVYFLKKCLPHWTYMCYFTSLKFTYRPHITLHVSKNNKLQLLFTMLYAYMCQQQICPQMPHMAITSCSHIGQLCQYIYLI